MLKSLVNLQIDKQKEFEKRIFVSAKNGSYRVQYEKIDAFAKFFKKIKNLIC